MLKNIIIPHPTEFVAYFCFFAYLQFLIVLILTTNKSLPPSIYEYKKKFYRILFLGVPFVSVAITTGVILILTAKDMAMSFIPDIFHSTYNLGNVVYNVILRILLIIFLYYIIQFILVIVKISKGLFSRLQNTSSHEEYEKIFEIIRFSYTLVAISFGMQISQLYLLIKPLNLRMGISYVVLLLTAFFFALSRRQDEESAPVSQRNSQIINFLEILLGLLGIILTLILVQTSPIPL